jgi:hypothetical protein
METQDTTEKQFAAWSKFRAACKRGYARFTTWCASWPLFAAVIVWTILAYLVFSVVAAMWTGWSVFQRLPEDLFEQVILVLATMMSLCAVVYLVIRYQEKKAAARTGVEALMDAAITKLGNPEHAAKIAGVYALADIADTHKGAYRQRVVDILCGYLRTNRTQDNAVEATIIGIMRKHLLKARAEEAGTTSVEQVMGDDQLWCDCDFNFHGTRFSEPFIFSYVTFEKTVSFVRAVFEEYALFEEVSFGQDAFFAGAQFKEYTFFATTYFEKGAYFTGTRFEDNAGFSGTSFEYDADFTCAVFVNDGDFTQASFTGSAQFKETLFKGNALCMAAMFEGLASYTHAAFEQGVHFEHAVFKQSSDFSNASFTKGKSISFSAGVSLINELPQGALWREPSEKSPETRVENSPVLAHNTAKS